MNTPRILTQRIAAAAAVLLFTPALHAVDRFWVTPAGGSFSSIANWSVTDGGAGGASVPVAADTARFTLNSTYTVTFSAAVTNSILDVWNGTVTFDLNGQTYTTTNGSVSFAVGTAVGQTARLTVRGGILAVDTTGDDVQIGVFGGTTGFLTISTGGRLGDGTFRPDLFIGASGAGTLTVNDNGRVDAQSAILGNVAGAVGTMTVTSPNAVVDLSSTLTVGGQGAGTVTVSNGGTLASAGLATLGSSLGGDGTVTVTGAGSSWASTANVIIGSVGDGTLNVTSGGLVTSSNPATLGGNATGIGTATVSGSGSRWNIASSQFIGNGGLGVMTVSSGGVVTATSATLGFAGGSEGRATITGTGSQWTMSSALTVGSNGTGEVTISAGGEVSATSVALGNFAGSTGELTLTGAGSKLTTTSTVTVANSGTGTLNVSDGAELVVGTNLLINNPAGTPLGTLTLDGGSIYVGSNFANTGAFNFTGGSLLVAGNFTSSGTFNFTDGTLQVIGDFQPNAAAAPLVIDGDNPADLPAIELLGAGITSNVTAITVGGDRQGRLVLRLGRQLNNGASGVNIGAGFGGEGNVVVESGATLTSTGTIAVGGSGVAPRGAGTLQINDGGTVDASTIQIHPGGIVALHGGTLRVDTMTYPGQFDWTTGTLRFDAANTSISSSVATELLGPDKTLRPGQTLATAAVGQLITLDDTLTVAGGRIEADNFDNFGTLKVFGGSTVTTTVFENLGTLELSDSLATVTGATQLANTGVIRGTGRIDGSELFNQVAGSVEIVAGQRLVLPDVTNAGRISVIGGELQTVNMANVASTGLISARDAILRFASVQNSGGMAFSNGTVDVYGDIIQNVGGRITISNGGIANFYDDVTINAGAASVQATALGANVSRAVFFGSYNGGLTGGGQAFIEGDHRPGNSAALVTFGGDVAYGTFATIETELGGTVRGTKYDAINVAGTLALDGTLDVALIGGFTPSLGQSFDLFNFAALSGAFSAMNLPVLGPALAWNISQLYSTGVISVSSTLTPIEQWRQSHFGSPADAGDGADSNDFDLDGSVNLLEYGLGMDPKVPNVAGLPQLSVVTAGANQHIALTIVRPLSATDITYRFEVSGSLASYDTGSSYSSGGDVPTNAFTTQVSRTDDGTFETLVVRDNTPLSGAVRRFLRLNVSNP